MLRHLLSLLLVATCAAAQLRAQTPLAWAHGSDHVATHLAAVQDEEYTHMAHPAFPKHGVRITRVKGFCDTTVGVYTGYVDVEAKHFFFWFFESRRNPDEDDVMLWLNGGPGGSSTLGMLTELGPCNIAGPNATVFNPHSWNSQVNLIVLDQPVGVGFSYADHGETVSRTEAAAVDVAAFFAILSETFPQFQGRKFHLAGESYGGRYVPLFGSAIVDNNAYLQKWGMQPINLASVMIGNGFSDVYSSYAFQYDMVCTGASGLAPVLSISTCVRMKEATKRCVAHLQTDCYDTHDDMACEAALSFCYEELKVPFATTDLNMYDLSKKCGDTYFCYSDFDDITALLNSTYIRRLIKTDVQPVNFMTVSFDVNQAFSYAGDESDVTTTAHLSGLLERGVRVLLYAGMYDTACSWLENERTSRIIEWSGQAAFANAPMREWEVDGRSVGKVRSSGLLTFATFHGAGHMVPHDKPIESLQMLKRWLAQQDM